MLLGSRFAKGMGAVFFGAFFQKQYVPAGPNLTEEWLVDPGFDNASVWDNLSTGVDVNGTYPSELNYTTTSGNTNGGTNALIRIPENGTYRLTIPPCDHIVSVGTNPFQVRFGKGVVTSVSGSLPAATFTNGGTFDFTVSNCATRVFNLKNNSVVAFAIPGLSIKRIA